MIYNITNINKWIKIYLNFLIYIIIKKVYIILIY